MEKNNINEYNGESCLWCKNENSSTCKKHAMEATREAVRGIMSCTSAYCSGRVTCDYYIKEDIKYAKYHIGECVPKIEKEIISDICIELRTEFSILQENWPNADIERFYLIFKRGDVETKLDFITCKKGEHTKEEARDILFENIKNSCIL